MIENLAIIRGVDQSVYPKNIIDFHGKPMIFDYILR